MMLLLACDLAHIFRGNQETQNYAQWKYARLSVKATMKDPQVFRSLSWS